MAKYLLFPTAADLSATDHAELAEAYERACDELVDVHGYSAEQLADAVEPMTVALLALYRSRRKEGTQPEIYAAERNRAAKDA